MTGSERTVGEQPELVSLIEGEPLLMSGRLVLRRLEQADSDALRELTDDPLVYRYLPTFLYEQQDPDIHAVIRGFYGDLFRKKQSLILAVCRKGAPETFCGLAEFYGFRNILHKTSIGYRLSEQFWGMGIAAQTVTLMTDYLFTETDTELVTASTMVENAASARVLEKNGFLRIARVPEDWGYPRLTVADKWVRRNHRKDEINRLKGRTVE